VTYLLDTNVLSEMRKRSRADRRVTAFSEHVGTRSIHTSWIVIAEMRRGAALARRRDPIQAKALDMWIAEVLESLGERVHPVDRPVAEKWADIMVPDPCSPMDALVAATALVHGLTVVTRNVSDFKNTGVAMLDPWTFEG
jgi:toxin FitB